MKGLEFFSGPGWKTLSVSLLHTLWQGALILILLALMLRLVRNPSRRYGLCLLALLGVLVCGLSTWAFLNQPATPEVSGSVSDMAPMEGGVSLAFDSEPSTQTSHAFNPEIDYRVMLIIGWLSGVLLMVARLFIQLRDVHHVRLDGYLVADEKVKLMANRIQRWMKIRRRVEIKVADHLVSPLVVGVIWPVIVLPVSVVTGMGQDMVRAILAHEFAHIRRHDYVVNLGQMVIETVLFFNPAVWWISRQVRIEREVCCDAEAAEATGDELDYARALAEYIELALPNRPAPLPAQAFGEKSRQGGFLLDRIRRLLVPEYRPSMRLPWMGIAGVIAVGGCMLFGLQQGTRLVVAAGVKLLTPEERIEKIREIKASYTVQAAYGELDEETLNKPESRVSISGTIQFEDGTPIKKSGVYVHGKSTRPGYNSEHSLNLAEDRFEGLVRPGDIYVTALAKGFAPSMIGPLEGMPGKKFEDLAFVMKRGFEYRIRFVDPAGAPLSGVDVEGRYDVPVYMKTMTGKSDEQGWTTFSNGVELAANLETRFPGFQDGRRRVELKPDLRLEWVLPRAEPIHIRLLTKEGGQPVSGVRARLFKIRGPYNMGWPIESGRVLARSNQDGELMLNTLRDDSTYWCILEGAGRQRTFLPALQAGMVDQTLQLGPALVVSGKITGDLSQLPRRSGKAKAPYISYENPYRFENENHRAWKSVKVDVRGKEGFFSITNLWSGTLDIQAGKTRISRDLTQPITNLVLHLAPPAPEVDRAVEKKRTVIFRFQPPDGHPPPEGRLKVVQSWRNSDGISKSEIQWLDIKEGAARLEVMASTRIHYRSEGLIGCWIKEAPGQVVEAGDEPLMVPIPCTPAGAIYGTLEDPDGSPATGVMITVVETERSPFRSPGALGVVVKNSSHAEDETDRFVAGPLPLGGKYRIVAYRGVNYTVGPEVELTAANPVQDMRLGFIKGVEYQGVVLKPDGQPAGGIRINLTYSPTPGHGFSPGDSMTDRLGRFTYKDLVPTVPGTYRIQLKENPGFQALLQVLDPFKKDTVIQLKAGHVIEGWVVDAASGWPIPGATVYAMPVPYGRIATGWVDARNKTDQEGRFHFDTLDADEYELNVRGARIEGDQIRVKGGTKGMFTIRAIPINAKLQPVPLRR